MRPQRARERRALRESPLDRPAVRPTESEHGNAQNPSGHGFLVADAGGGTLDISSYAIRGTSPLVMEEIAPPDCACSAPPGARCH